MAEFKCKYCGNHLHPVEGQTFITCPRCDETTRIVWQDNSKKARLLEEADDLRFRCLFDRAKHNYEVIIEDYPDEADAYWGYILCEYGVEFQESGRTGKRVPTLHRISQKSVLMDPYYQKVLELANPADRKDYQRIAGEMDRIRLRFLELSQKEENRYDIFISFKQTDDRTGRETIDCSRAENLYYKLKDMGYKVFFSKVTLAGRGGEDYEPIIYTALEAARIMLVVGSSGENLDAPWVRNEWSRFLDMMQERKDKKLLPVSVEGMRAGDLPDALQGIQGYNIDTSIGTDRLLSRIVELLPGKEKERSEKVQPEASSFGASEKSLLKRAELEARAGNWEGAASYYNKVLEANPESAPAWMGLMLSADEYRCVDLDAFGKLLVERGSQGEYQSVSVTMDSAGAKDDIYVVPGYLEKEEIAGMVPSQLSYETNTEALEKNLQEQEEWFETNRYFSYAVSYADEDYARQLEHLKSLVLGELRENLEQAQREETRAESQLRQQYARELQEAREKVEKRSAEALAAREQDYKAGTEVKKSSDIPEAIRRLKKTGGYKDSEEKLKKLGEVQKKLNVIGEGKNYLREAVSNLHPTVFNEYEQAVRNIKGSNPGLFFWVKLAIYALLVFAYLFVAIRTGMASGFYIKSRGRLVLYNCAWTLIFMAAGILAAVVFKKVPALGYILYAVAYTLAFRTQYMPAVFSYVIFYFSLPVPESFVHAMYQNITLDIQTVIMAVIFLLSWILKSGVAHHFITRSSSTAVVGKYRKVIAGAETQAKDELNRIWQDALGRDYDGPTLESYLKN